jgi:hypothetical protein
MAATTIEAIPNSGGEQPTAGATSEATSPVAPRVLWRAVVRTGGQLSASRERDRVEWHLSGCTAPQSDGNHCSEGRHLIETIGHPDGHCIVDGVGGLGGATPPSDE